MEIIEMKCRSYTRKWLRLHKCQNNSALYGKVIQLELPITSIKAGKVRIAMMLGFSNDLSIKVQTGKRWQAECEVDKAAEGA